MTLPSKFLFFASFCHRIEMKLETRRKSCSLTSFMFPDFLELKFKILREMSSQEYDEDLFLKN